jgi:hypothetical protein
MPIPEKRPDTPHNRLRAKAQEWLKCGHSRNALSALSGVPFSVLTDFLDGTRTVGSVVCVEISRTIGYTPPLRSAYAWNQEYTPLTDPENVQFDAIDDN